MGWKDRVPVMAAALWWGSLTTLGLVVVPSLFTHLPTAAMAGQMAAKLFAAQTWVSVGSGLLLIISARAGGETARMDWGRGALLYVFAGMLLALLVEFAVAPRILARVDLKLWHTAGSTMFALQWLCAGVVLWKLCAVRSDGPS
jgi:hypothetical protein